MELPLSNAKPLPLVKGKTGFSKQLSLRNKATEWDLRMEGGVGGWIQGCYLAKHLRTVNVNQN